MGVVDQAALVLTQCHKCAGCNRLEQESFRGDDKCQNYRKADTDVSIERRYGLLGESGEEENGHTGNWQPSSTARKVR